MSKQHQINENDRRTKGLYRVGVIKSVNYRDGTAVVDMGKGLISPPLPWGASTLGDLSIWSPPRIGQHVEVKSASGELAQARIGMSFQKDGHKFPTSSKHTVHLQFKDGAHFIYNHATHELHINIPEKTVLHSPKIKIFGDVDIDGGVTVSEDVIAAGVSLVKHKHTGVKPGNAKTGLPESTESTIGV